MLAEGLWGLSMLALCRNNVLTEGVMGAHVLGGLHGRAEFPTSDRPALVNGTPEIGTVKSASPKLHFANYREVSCAHSNVDKTNCAISIRCRYTHQIAVR